MPETFPQKESAAPAPETGGDNAEKRKAELDVLIQVALTRSLEEAFKRAEQESPYLLDELRDRLATDEYYKKLVESAKVEEL